MTTKRKEEERRHQILWAAIACVAESGIEGATLKSIARRAGASTGMITYYFKDKNELIENALAFGHKMVGERTRQVRDASPGPEHLTALFNASLLDAAPDVPPLRFWIEYWAHATRDPELMEFRAERISRFRQTIARSVSAGAERGDFREDIDPLLAADLLQALLDGLQLKLALDSKSISPARAMKVFRLLMEMMQGNAAGGEPPPRQKVTVQVEGDDPSSLPAPLRVL